MCEKTKQGITLYKCNKDPGHEGCHSFSWEEKDEKTGKMMAWETFW